MVVVLIGYGIIALKFRKISKMSANSFSEARGMLTVIVMSCKC